MNELQVERRKARRFWVAPLLAFGIGLLMGPLIAPLVFDWSGIGKLPIANALGITQGSQIWTGPLPPPPGPFSMGGAPINDFLRKLAFQMWPLWIISGFFFAGTTFVFLMLRDFYRLARAK